MNSARDDLRKLLKGFKDHVWAIEEAYSQVQLAADFRERGDERRAVLCDRAAGAALRCAIEIELQVPSAANDDEQKSLQ